ncbi:MAG: PKD domain-containing protein [Nocardioides sp.]|uniref:PKD domain-containing protein n=1 Tax=Nocardioides sp. TaxID=35761 RepID=UPI0039E6A52F
MGFRRLCRIVIATLIALATAATTVAVTTSPVAAAPADLSFVASASTAGARTSHRVVIPASVQAGDALVLVLTTNNLNGTVTAPSGWESLQSREGKGIRGRLWSKTATASDAGSTITVTSSASAKSAMVVAAYRSSGGTARVTASAIGGSDSAAASHTTPSVAVAEQQSWLVSAWSEKSPTVATWQLPGGVTQRTTASANGTGKVSAVFADSNGAVAVGTAAGRTATTTANVNRSVLYSVVVSPGETTTGPTNTPPVARFTSSCAGLTCSFDAAGSSDADGDSLTYSWAFGDGQTGTGVSPTHAYSNGTTRTVTLTVSDSQATGQTTGQVSPQAPTSGPGHTAVVPDIVSTNMPRITSGEIEDLEYIGNRVYVAGGFSSIRNNTSGNTTNYDQRFLAAFNLTTGLVDANFRPTFSGGGVSDIEASPDGTKLFVAGTFNSVNGVAKKKFASINPTTGATISGWTADANGAGTELRGHQLHRLPRREVHQDQRRRPPRPRRRQRHYRRARRPHQRQSGRHLEQRHHRWDRTQRLAQRAGAQAHPRPLQARRGAHRPTDRRPRPLRRRHHQHRHRSALALADPAMGGQPAVRRRHPARLRR